MIKLCNYCRKELSKEDGERIFCSSWCKEQKQFERKEVKEIKIKKVKAEKPKRIKKVKVLKFPFNCINCKNRLKLKGYCSQECRRKKYEKNKICTLNRKLSTGKNK